MISAPAVERRELHTQHLSADLVVGGGAVLRLTVFTKSTGPGSRRVELRQSSKVDNHTPDVTLEQLEVAVKAGENQALELNFQHRFTESRYAFVCFVGDEAVSLRCSEQWVTGVLSLCHEANRAVAESAVQTPPADIGVDQFEFWQPRRRPGGHNIALRLGQPLTVFRATNVINGIARPTANPNAWVAAVDDPAPALTLSWTEPQTVARVELSFDSDFDHPMESVLWGHPENAMPSCVQRYRLIDGDTGAVHASRTDNHQTRNVILLPQAVRTKSLRLEVGHPSAHYPAALFEVRCYPSAQLP